MRQIRSLGSILFFCGALVCMTSYTVAQLPMYSADFRLLPTIQTKGELADALGIMGIVDRSYEVQGAKVIEYYEMNTGRFLGFAGDTNQFEVRRLPYLRRSPMMRRLVDQFGPAEAHAIRQGKFLPGLLQKDIQAMHGWPEERKRESDKVIWIYSEVILEFEGKVLTTITPRGT